MTVFVKVVELQGLAPAARLLGMAPSAVSRTLARLEQRLGVQLLRRSTRRVAPTAEGERFYRRAVAVLTDLDDAEREASCGAQPAGRVRLNTSATYVAHVLCPILPEFFARYPDVRLDIIQSDALADLVTEGSDVAVRAGPMPSSDLIVRSLGEARLVLVATPDWIARNGDLAEVGDRLVGFTHRRLTETWSPNSSPDAQLVRISDGEGMRRLALAGIAPARLAEFTVRDELASGRLVELPDPALAGVCEKFHAVFVGRRATLPSRVRALLNYLSEKGRVSKT